MAKKKIRKRKGRDVAKARSVVFQKDVRRAELRKRGVTPEYCRALIEEFDRMLAETPAC